MPPKLPKPKPPALTHFLCIPLVTSSSRPQLQKSLATFRERLSQKGIPDLPDGLPEKAIRPLGTLHLTLGVMSLLTPEKVEGALKLLRELDIKSLFSQPSPVKFAPKLPAGPDSKVKEKEKETEGQAKPENLKITLQGLRPMQTPSKTSILYSSPLDPDLRLFQFCTSLRQTFTEAGFIEDQKKLLLHATIVNTVYAKGVKGKGTGHGKRGGAKLMIDASEILEEFEEFEFMENVRVERVAVCRMGAKPDEDGEVAYEVEGEIEVPEF
ncbi:uncharacterized protein PAC_02870 [Phialocephala subalpina]|uniref:A-kinase anchor protein 7-like phosphoesterase domain-containing protein n=1 Tax=Phialocephala subalpina TaxID=576137 RepID=A0A1L7WJN7_9HELO|nr:uncharacterized protein PAC_02870 [Phialocephala subalpina]